MIPHKHTVSVLMFWASIGSLLVMGSVACRSAPYRSSEFQSAQKLLAPKSFSEAKRRMKEVYSDHRLTFYCGCDFDENLSVDHQSCGYVPSTDNDRAHRVEWEHIVPAHAFGQSFPAWRDGHPDCVDSRGQPFKGRRCARRVEPEFRRMESDMHNLVPAIGEINGLRSNFEMAMLPGEPREFGACDVEISDRKIEPRPEVRGDISRIYQYMNQTYPRRSIVSEKNRRLLETWSKLDPQDSWELVRNRRIRSVESVGLRSIGEF